MITVVLPTTLEFIFEIRSLSPQFYMFPSENVTPILNKLITKYHYGVNINGEVY